MQEDLVPAITDRRALRALAWMCRQYLMRDGGLQHDFMSAGEDSLALLADYGFVTLEFGGGNWTSTGLQLLDEDN